MSRAGSSRLHVLGDAGDFSAGAQHRVRGLCIDFACVMPGLKARATVPQARDSLLVRFLGAGCRVSLKRVRASHQSCRAR
jgi:hypothetical protein